MNMSESIKEIAAAIAQVQKELPAVPKDITNPITHSKYANLDSINKALLPVTSKNGIAVTQYPVSSGGQIGCGTLLMHISGEFIDYGPYMINVDKNKRMSAAQEGGSTITYAKRYQLSAIFGIVSDNDDDGVQPQPQNGQNNQYQGNQQNRGQQQQGDPRQGRPNQYGSNQSQQGNEAITDKQIATLVSLFQAIAKVSGKDLPTVQNGYFNQLQINNLKQLNHTEASQLTERVIGKLTNMGGNTNDQSSGTNGPTH
ncbi:ERF family protein [Levilactobacillus lanxiensis]|uniref:ERF family protein n=1 Tax=Levilactobacillus lanxiensis TaxID=2799568 RepID=A0ABW4D5N9_9LACO|nr:ERF family protein [Levilactobacillus lanxiensis]